MKGKRRISIDIDGDVFDRLNAILPWGQKSRLFNIIAEDILDLVDRHGMEALGFILTRQLKVESYSGKLKGVKEEHNTDE